jgi:hypothetical protein
MEKAKKIISFENLPANLQAELKKKYPNGYAGHVQKLATPKETFNVVPLETADALYMVKVKYVEKKSKSMDDDDDEFFGDDDFSVPDDEEETEYDKPEVDDEEDEDSGDAGGGDDDED